MVPPSCTTCAGWTTGATRSTGSAAARWVLANRGLLPLPLSDTQLEAVAYCCRWHVPPDASAPGMTPELVCLKDADALDRVRIFDP